MPDAPVDPDDVLSGAQRLDLAIAREILLPREAQTLRTIVRHLLAANEVVREKDDPQDATAVTLLHSCLSELAEFGR